MDEQTPKKASHGGKRANAGRVSTLKPDERANKHTLCFDEMTRRKLFVLGQGNLSDGARIAARFAFDGFQSGRLVLEPSAKP